MHSSSARLTAVRRATLSSVLRALWLSVLAFGVGARAQGSPDEEFPGAIVRPKRTQPKPSRPPAPLPPPAPVKPPPPPKPAPACALGLQVDQHFTAEGLRLEGFVLNRTAKALRFSLVNACPNPPLQFSGLPVGVSAFDTCAAGPCVKRDPIQVTLKAGERRQLATGFAPWAGNTCSAPLVVDDFRLTAQLAFAGSSVSTCTVPGTVQTTPVRLPPSTCPPPEPCGVYCPYGTAKDERGCSTCGCNPSPLTVPSPSPTR